MKTRYIQVSVTSGILFGVMDALINANPLAQKLFSVFEPIARKSIDIPMGITIDLIFGFAMGGIFLLLYQSLPGRSNVMKGLGFGFLVWFFRVAMQVASQWMMFSIPPIALVYILVCGLIEMLILGLIYSLLLKPSMK